MADSGAHSLFKIASGRTTPAAIGTGFPTPSGTAFDAAGNLYVADSTNNQIVEIPNVGGSLVPASQVTLVANTTDVRWNGVEQSKRIGGKARRHAVYR